jgi:hypothetical protein
MLNRHGSRVKIPAHTAIVGDCAGSSWIRLSNAFASPKYLDGAVRTELDVGRLQVAGRDAAFVRGIQGVGNLPGDRDGLAHRERSARDVLGERLPLDQFHHQRAGAV